MKKYFDSELKDMMDKAKGLFGDSDDNDATLEAGEGSEEIDENFLQVTAYNFKNFGSQEKKEDGAQPHIATMNASQDFMQMPHEGDESDSSSSDVDDMNNDKDKYSDNSDNKSNEFGQRESSHYTGEESFDSETGNHMENVSGDDDGLEGSTPTGQGR